MARCRFCGNTSLVWFDRNNPTGRPPQPPETPGLRVGIPIATSPAWQLNTSSGERHFCELARIYYQARNNRETVKTQLIDEFLRPYASIAVPAPETVAFLNGLEAMYQARLPIQTPAVGVPNTGFVGQGGVIDTHAPSDILPTPVRRLTGDIGRRVNYFDGDDEDELSLIHISEPTRPY